MTWTYKQSSGELFHNGQFIEKGYSGRMTNKNNPDRQQVRGLGPLPRGIYRISGQSNSKGPMTIILVQTSGESFGRSAFRIHGEKVSGVPGWASEGCIIMGPKTRRRILDSNDNTLEVIR
ncbi:DUF2778 domain-containing protein [Erwinia endophytica]|uniref:tlde1 domain-containing protein n=1 Tax=Erwinia endophytica TaxID=1563158 RepID=UPI001265F69D|nr:tlde1 domain-containing protein [Erwinia endophytica]KAB8306708.1 DUF2778 domain-containing protein [Erwinia endophytica]